MTKLSEIKDLEDVKRNIRTLWAAIGSMTTQLYSIAGNIGEAQNLFEECMGDTKALKELLIEIKKMSKGEDNKAVEIINEMQEYRKEQGLEILVPQ